VQIKLQYLFLPLCCGFVVMIIPDYLQIITQFT
jgi:hypothetical protein